MKQTDTDFIYTFLPHIGNTHCKFIKYHTFMGYVIYCLNANFFVSKLINFKQKP